MAVQFEFKSNLEVFVKAMRGQTDDAAEKIRQAAIEAIQEKMLYGYHDPHGPDGHTEIVDTGKTFDTVDANVKRDSQNLITVEAGTGTKCSVFVHNGTRKLKARPFIRDALTEKMSEFQEMWESSLRG